MNTARIPNWFWVISGILLLWHMVGLGSFIYHTFMMSEEAIEALPEKERILYGQYPMWSHLIFAIATITAFLGNILLFDQKKMAISLFVISFIAIIIQMGHHLFMTSAVEVYGKTTYMMPVLVILIAAFCLWLSNHAKNQEWID